jgi:hypothetical protein
MFISDPDKTDSIFSEEGSTQGDVTAMAMYAIGIRPLIDILNNETDPSTCQQAWYADDSSGMYSIKMVQNLATFPRHPKPY